MHKVWIIAIGLSLVACSTGYQSTKLEYAPYRIQGSQAKDPQLDSLMRSYGDRIAGKMNEVIAQVGHTMEKDRPESELGNLLADAMRKQASLHYGKKIDLALLNYGGVRVNQLNQGPLTRGKVYEIMPFDNLLVVQTIRGSTLQQLLDLVAGKDGWPISGVRMQIKNKKAVSVWIGDQPLDPTATYLLANTDYIANGGDDCVFLKNQPTLQDGYLLRDAFIDYFTAQGKSGQPLQSNKEKRIEYAQ